MIRINLLPFREARRRAEVARHLAIIGVVAGVAGLGCLTAYLAVASDVRTARAEISQTKALIDGYKPQLAQVKEFREKKAAVEEKLAVIARLERNRRGPIHVLDELASRSPERLWITSMETSGSSIRLDGMGLNNQVVAAFMTALNESPYFGEVELERTELSESNGLKFSKFGIRAQLTHPEEDAG